MRWAGEGLGFAIDTVLLVRRVEVLRGLSVGFWSACTVMFGVCSDWRSDYARHCCGGGKLNGDKAVE